MVSSPMTQYSPDEPLFDVLVTVIVPVYNTRVELVERAVASARHQTHSKFELLIVDDGSSAETAKSLDRLADGDPRIRVVHQENAGVSAARNTGVDYAKGEFIAYLDADDYLEPEFLSAALNVACAAGADAVFGGMRVLHNGGSTKWRTGGPPAKGAQLGTSETIISACVHALSDSPSTRQATEVLSVTNVLSALYTADTARRHRFPVGVSHAEDRLHNVHVLLGARRVMFCSDPWYVYDTTHDQGATRRATSKTVSDLTRTVREFAAIESVLSNYGVQSDGPHERIARAASDGVLNYLKVLSGVMVEMRGLQTNRAQLQKLLAEPSVGNAIAKATKSGWQDRIFGGAARLRRTDLVLALGWLWVRAGGLQMSVDPPNQSLKVRNDKNG